MTKTEAYLVYDVETREWGFRNPDGSGCPVIKSPQSKTEFAYNLGLAVAEWGYQPYPTIQELLNNSKPLLTPIFLSLRCY